MSQLSTSLEHSIRLRTSGANKLEHEAMFRKYFCVDVGIAVIKGGGCRWIYSWYYQEATIDADVIEGMIKTIPTFCE